jgi:pilus assembly protein Flp/PilA
MGSRFPSLRRFAVRLHAVMLSRRGTSSVEYGLILAFIVLAIMGALSTFAGATIGMWTDIATRVTEAR